MYLLSRYVPLCSGEQDTAARVMKVRAGETVRMLLELDQDVSEPRVSCEMANTLTTHTDGPQESRSSWNVRT